MVAVSLQGGVWIGALVRQAQLDQSGYQWAFQEPYNSNRQQLHFVSHFIQKVERNVLRNGHWLLESWQSLFQWFGRSKQPSQRWLHTFCLPQSSWIHWVSHATTCIQGTYVVCSSKGILWCWGTYLLRGEIKRLVAEWTDMLVELCHTCDDFDHFNSYGSRAALGATIVPLFGSSDQTHLTNYSGDKLEWPVYLSLGNVDPVNKSKPSNPASILVSLFAVPPKYHFKGHGKRTAPKERQIHNWEVLRKVFVLIVLPLDALSNTGKLMLSADRRMRQWHPVICAWMAEYFGNIRLQWIKPPHWPMCEAPKSSFGEVNSLSWQLRDYWLYFHKMILATKGDAMGRQTIFGRSSDWNIRRHPMEYEMHLWQLLSYLIFFIPSISVRLGIWWTG